MFFGARRVRDIRSRMQWPKQLSLVFAMMGYCVGLANLLMFSYKAAQGGGGSVHVVLLCPALFSRRISIRLCDHVLCARHPAPHTGDLRRANVREGTGAAHEQAGQSVVQR